MRLSIIFIILAIFLNLSAYSEDFSYLKPPYTFSQREQSIKALGQKIKAYVFQTTLTKNELINFYDRILKDKGFTKSSKEFKQAGLRFFKYTKKGQVINIQIMKAQGSLPALTVIASIYNQPSSNSYEGCPTCGAGPSSNNTSASSSSIPKSFDNILKDLPGEDLDFIPRPKGSIRVVNLKNDNPFMVNIVYKCSQSIEELKNFYKQNMGYHYWKLVAEFSPSQIKSELKNLNIQRSIPQGAPLSLDALSSSYNLYFKGSYGNATIVIMENPQGEGRLANILYRR